MKSLRHGVTFVCTALALVIVGILFSHNAVVAQAAKVDGGLSKVSKIYHSTLSSKKIQLYWDDEEGLADGYQYQVYSAQSYDNQRVTAGRTTETNVVVNVSKRAFYKVKVRPYIYVNGKIEYGQYSKWYYFSQDIVPTLKCNNRGIQVKHKPIEGATFYTIYATTKKNAKLESYVRVGRTNGHAMTIKKYKNSALKKNTKYYFYVVAEKQIGNTIYLGNPSSIRSMTYK